MSQKERQVLKGCGQRAAGAGRGRRRGRQNVSLWGGVFLLPYEYDISQIIDELPATQPSEQRNPNA